MKACLSLRRLRPFTLFLTIGLGACGVARIFSSAEEPGRLFSHKLHVQGQDLTCKSCHGKAEKEDQAGMPTSLKKCMLCHEGEDEKKPEDRKLAALLGEKPVWSSFTDEGEDIKFSHKEHVVEGKLDCAQCHPGMEQNESVTSSLRLSMKQCMDCHASRQVSNDCLTCHKTMRKDTPPASHSLNWQRSHGQVMRSKDRGRLDADCALCHTEESCNICHSIESPQSHNNHWRLRQHGIAAEVDRTACATCHQEDSCIRCHSDTTPRSHTATWGGAQQRHCLTCHVGESRDNSCATCHSDLEHRNAPRRPDNNQHARVTDDDCLRCHSVIGLPHLDNGDSCGSCH